MLDIKAIVLILIIWSGIGIFVLTKLDEVYTKYTNYYFATEFLSPTWLYKTHKRLNILGVLVVTILYNLISPIYSLFYWLVKFIIFICTVGRKLDEE